MKNLVTCIYGSKLFGLDNAKSDTDLKSVFLPSLRDCVLMSHRLNYSEKSGEGSEKKEHEHFTLQQFLQMAMNSDDITVGLLHASDRHIQQTSDVFEYLRENKSKFYTKGMTSAAGFAKSQALKYGIRADRMLVVEKVMAAISHAMVSGHAKICDCWDNLPDLDFTRRYVSDNNRDAVDKRIYEVIGKGLPATLKLGDAYDILAKARDQFGERVRMAKEMDGKDLKAISHSFRVCYQLLHIYRDGGFTYPLPESDFIKAVKEGRLNYYIDKLGDKLDGLLFEVEQEAKKSSYPDAVDQKWVNEVIFNAYGLQEGSNVMIRL